MTRTIQVTVCSPTVAFKTVLPLEIAVTTPLASTVAILVSSMVQEVTGSSVPLTCMVTFPPTLRLTSPSSQPELSTSFSLGGSGRGVATLTVQAADWEPSAVVTVMVAVPGIPAVTRPVSSTVATLVSLLVQRTSSAPVTVRVAVSAWFRFRVVWSRVRGVAGAGLGAHGAALALGIVDDGHVVDHVDGVELTGALAQAAADAGVGADLGDGGALVLVGAVDEHLLGIGDLHDQLPGAGLAAGAAVGALFLVHHGRAVFTHMDGVELTGGHAGAEAQAAVLAGQSVAGQDLSGG